MSCIVAVSLVGDRKDGEQRETFGARDLLFCVRIIDHIRVCLRIYLGKKLDQPPTKFSKFHNMFNLMRTRLMLHYI